MIKKLGKKIIKCAKKININKFPKVSKNSCGYRLDCINSLKDTHKILVGSEGTLGNCVICKIKFKKFTFKANTFCYRISIGSKR